MTGEGTIRNIPSENDRKPNFDTRSTTKNWTSYVLNTVLSRGHEGLMGVEVRRKPVSASEHFYGVHVVRTPVKITL